LGSVALSALGILHAPVGFEVTRTHGPFGGTKLVSLARNEE
jgi:hypothetical protein